MIFYGASITESDIILPDGKSLERTGVIPDELLLPTAADLAARHDPLLSHAALLVGATLAADKAGALFPLDKEKW